MTELSNLVRQRLASGEEPRVHPDPDTLTAFLEQLLPLPERNQVLEHIAVCSQCREVMALSLPEQPVTDDRAAVTVLAPSRRGWRSWKPALGLAASLAGLAIVATAIIELPRGSMPKQANRPAAVTSADSNAPTPMPAQPEPAATQPGAAPRTDARSMPRQEEPVTEPQILAPSPTAERATVTPPPKAGDSIAGGPYVNVQMFANENAGNATTNMTAMTAANNLPPAPTPRALGDHARTGLLNESNPLNAFTDLPRPTQSRKPLGVLTPPSNIIRFGLFTGKTVGQDAKRLFQKRSTPSIAPGALAFSTMGRQFNPAMEKDLSLEAVAAAPIADKNAAELDQSRAFSPLALAGAGGALKVEGAAAANKTTRKAASPQPAWKVADGKLLKLGDSGVWTEGFSAGEGIDFTVFTAHGQDVWAGGGQAALVHSRDGGATWERLTLGASATGTITSIEASGLRVLVKSSSGQSWSSPDGGKTWVLQD